MDGNRSLLFLGRPSIGLDSPCYCLCAALSPSELTEAGHTQSACCAWKLEVGCRELETIGSRVAHSHSNNFLTGTERMSSSHHLRDYEIGF
jgi:hypothetical protein